MLPRTHLLLLCLLLASRLPAPEARILVQAPEEQAPCPGCSEPLQERLVDALYEATHQGVFPRDAAVLKAFLFDRCDQWSFLLGVYTGITKFIEDFLEMCYKPAFARAIQERSVVRCIDDIYQEFEQHPGFEGAAQLGHYHAWFKTHKPLLEALENPGPLEPGAKVLLTGFNSLAPRLNGALGQICNVTQMPGDRLPVRLVRPPSAATAHPSSVRVSADHLDRVPPGVAAAVILLGSDVQPAYASSFTARGALRKGGRLPPGWFRSGVAERVGVPLALLPLTSTSERFADESMGLLLLADTETGAVPDDAAQSGLGQVLVARTDGRDVTVGELLDLHQYNLYLKGKWGEWSHGATAGSLARQKALTPGAYQAFLDTRRRRPAVVTRARL